MRLYGDFGGRLLWLKSGENAPGVGVLVTVW